MTTERKTWSDRTAWQSKIEGLNFSADQHWDTCKVMIKASEGGGKFEIVVTVDGREIDSQSFTLDDGKSKQFEYKIDKRCSVSITGALSKAQVFHGAGGTVTVECAYDETQSWLKESKTWEDETGVCSTVENLYLTENHQWLKSEVKVEGHRMKSTGCMVTLIANGELKYPLPGWMELDGTESKTHTFDIGARVPLVVAGYITNTHAVTGGGAKITLSGLYKKGEPASDATAKQEANAEDMERKRKEMWESATLSKSIDYDGHIKPYSGGNIQHYDNAGLTSQVKAFVGGIGGIHAGYVGVRKDGDITIGFRGTEGGIDWLNNFAAFQVPFPPYNGSKVHAGFSDAVASIESGMLAEVQRLGVANKKIYITGHSKGGAMATLMAVILEKELHLANENIEVWTFASPRVGDKIFKEKYNKKHYRYEAFLDVVPHLPFTSGESEVLTRLSTVYEQGGNIFSPYISLPPYCSVGTRICLNPNHSPHGKIPVETDNSTGETLNSFCAMEEALRKEGPSLMLDVHTADYQV